jgi:hypothetical protein
MKKTLLMCGLLTMMAAAPMFAGDVKRDWKTAKVVDSQLDPSLQVNQLALVGDEYTYTVQEAKVRSNGSPLGDIASALENRRHGCHFIVRDDVTYWQEKSTLHVIDADGKECK